MSRIIKIYLTDEIYEECWKQYFYRKVEEDVDN